MTRGERIAAEALGTDKPKNEPIMTAHHPFLRAVIPFTESCRYWIGLATELLEELGDSTTPPNIVTKLLNKYDYDYFYRQNIVIRFRRTSRKRLIEFTDYRYGKMLTEGIRKNFLSGKIPTERMPSQRKKVFPRSYSVIKSRYRSRTIHTPAVIKQCH